MRLQLLSFVVLLVACSKTPPAPAPPVLDASVRPDAAPVSSATPDAGPPSAEARAAALKELDQGRRRSRAKDWSKALDHFDRALVVMPDDARILSEVGWAAFQANRLDRAEEANARALANAKEPLVRAPILYNIGRVAEARNKPDLARKAYKDSLAFRTNAEVKRRLDGLANGAVTDDSDTTTIGCRNKNFADVPALCRCLKADGKDDLFIPDTAELICRRMTTKPLGDGRFGVVEVGADMIGERAHLLTVNETGGVRWLRNLGSDYEPGAFGVHNTAHVLGGESRNVAGHTVVIVHSAQDDNDFNLAGLELCEYHAKLDTICAFGEKAGETRCTPPIPTEVRSGCGPGVMPEDPDEAMKETLRELKKNATSKSAKAEYTIGENGMVSVSVVSGTPDLIGGDARNPPPLWK